MKTQSRYDKALALCAQVAAALNREKAQRRPGPTNSTTMTAPKLSLLAQYAALNGAAKFSHYQAHAPALWHEFSKGVRA